MVQFDLQFTEAHNALLFDTPVNVASKPALISWIEHAQDLEAKHLRDLERLRRP